MRINYIKNLNNGSLQIKAITFWQALLLSFIFDIIYSFISAPISLALEIYKNEIFISTFNKNILISITDFIYQYIATLTIIVLTKNRIKNHDRVLYEKTSKNQYLAGVGMAVGYILITYGIFDILLYSLPTLNEGLYEYIEEYFLNTSYIFIFISTCVIAPIFEELLYRGVLLNGLLRKYNFKKAIIYSSLIFAIAHMNLPQGINAFCIGIIIGIVYYYTKSLYICMLMHFANNFLVNFIVYPESILWRIILFIIVPIIGFSVFIVSFKRIKENRVVEEG